MKKKATIKGLVDNSTDIIERCTSLLFKENPSVEDISGYYSNRATIYRAHQNDPRVDINGNDKKRFKRKADASRRMYDEVSKSIETPFD